MRRLVDANVIIRYLLGDIPTQAVKARDEINRGVFLGDGVLAEIVYVLGGHYGMSRERVCPLLIELLNEVGSPNPVVGKRALEIYAKKPKLDFIDCLLAASKQIEGDEILTFDRDLLKYLSAAK